MIARTVLTIALLGAAAAAAPVAAQQQRNAPFTLQRALGAPDGLKISGSVRGRYEALHNQFRPGLGRNDDLFVLRSTLFAEYDSGLIRIGGELMDSRAYFTDAGSSVSTSEVNALELVQGYVGVDLGAALGSGSTTSIDVGRFTMDLGSRRLAGRNSYRNTTNAFAGVRTEFHGADKSYLTLFYTLPLNRLPNDKQGILHNKVKWDRESFDVAFWGGFLNKPGLAGRANLDLYFFGLNERDSPDYPTKDRQLYTPGIRLFSDPKPGRTDFEFEGAYQFGRTSTGTAANAPEQNVAAYLLHAEVGHQFDASWKPRLSFEYDLVSGDDPGGDYGHFDGLYGPRRSDYGPTGIFGPLGRNNISSPGVRLEVTPSGRWDGFAMYRANWLDSATDSFANTGVRDPAGASGKFAGHQLEGRVRYWVVPSLLRLETGGAVLVNGRFLNDAPNATGYGDSVYGYFDLTATF